MRTRTRSLPALAACGLLTLGLTGCSKSVQTDDLETQVEKLASEKGFDVDTVDCPDPLPAEVDAKVACTVTTADGKEHPVDVTATKVDGSQVEFNVVEQ